MWEAAGYRVIGLTASQAARDVLAEAGVREAYNSAQFLEWLDRGKITIAPGTLFVIDEAGAMPTQHMARIVDLAERVNGKVHEVGDHRQLAAVGGGGGFRLTADAGGYSQLVVPLRFREEWEAAASLRLRGGDQSVLDDYNEHGRISGGDREQVLDEARQAYVAGRLAGEDVMLMAYTRQDCRDLSRMIRDDLIHLGLVHDGAAAKLREGAQASAGDLIVCRKTDHRVITDERHELANGDVFRVERITPRGAVVRRVLEANGEIRLASHSTFYGAEKLAQSELGYAVTGHKGQGATVTRGLAVITGCESLEWLYVALTRGRERNTVIALTRDGVREAGDGEKPVAVQPRQADPRSGTRPDPELARRERREAERAGLPGETQSARAEHEREPIAVLADCMGREEAEDAATAVQKRNLVNADHLGILGTRFDDLTAKASRERYEQLVMDALPEEYRGGLSSASTWLYRTLRSAEAAGLDAGEVIHAAVNSRSLAGARDVASVLDARLRRMVDPLVPAPHTGWSDRVPEIADPEIQEYVTRDAAAMDERADRLGEHAAETSKESVVDLLGPVPDDPVARLDWTQRASKIERYRERYNIAEAEGIGAEPTGNAPEMRQLWWSAFSAITRTDGLDVRQLPDKSLEHMRASYKDETGWAPPHVGKILADVRRGADRMQVRAIRADAEADVAEDEATIAQHASIAAKARQLEAQHREHERILAEAQEDRRLWDQFTAGARALAVQADSELRRRYPERKMVPLVSAEPRAPEAGLREPGWKAELDEQRRVFLEEYEARQNVRVPDEDPDYQDQGEAWAAWQPHHDAILQPPPPELRPAEGVLQAQREWEAGA